MERYVLVIVLICGIATAQSSPANKQYRTDYEYSKGNDAFYKLHVESRTSRRAQMLCEAEGASLVPPTPEDVRQVHGMLKRFPDLGPAVVVAADGQRHDSLEEEPMINLEPEQPATALDCNVVTRSGDVDSVACWRSEPFVCKVAARDAYYDDQCGVYAKGYISKISTTGSCYSVSKTALTWNEAFAECAAQGAHLVVLNTEGEHEEVTQLLQAAPDVTNAIAAYFYFAGIRADRPKDNTPRVFKTVLNQTLEEAGYAGWSANEPNNYKDNEYCGSLFRNDGKYNDLDCVLVYGFVCEKERRIVK